MPTEQIASLETDYTLQLISPGSVFQKLHHLAQAGNPEAQYHLSLCYEDGEGVAKNEEKALYWLRQSAAQDFPPAMTELAWIRFEDRNAPEAKEEAISLIKRAAAALYPPAMHAHATLLWTGQDVPCDKRASLRVFTIAAEKNYRLSQHFLGTLYWNGDESLGLAPDRKTALTYLEQASRDMDIGACASYAAAVYNDRAGNMGLAFKRGQKAFQALKKGSQDYVSSVSARNMATLQTNLNKLFTTAKRRFTQNGNLELIFPDGTKAKTPWSDGLPYPHLQLS